jgi:hypothetical protein
VLATAARRDEEGRRMANAPVGPEHAVRFMMGLVLLGDACGPPHGPAHFSRRVKLGLKELDHIWAARFLAPFREAKRTDTAHGPSFLSVDGLLQDSIPHEYMLIFWVPFIL